MQKSGNFATTWIAIALAGVAVLLQSSPLSATITPTSNATDLAQAIESSPGIVTGASFVALPPTGTPNGTSDAPLTGFPTDGATFAIMTTGNVSLADQPNNSPDSGANDSGGNVRGNTDFDVSILRIDLNVPTGANCLSIDFEFLSEEFPEFVGSPFNDAFIAELDSSTWSTSGSTITAPNNFAFDPTSNVISINAAGVTSMTAANSAGTTYDGSTPLLTASTPITPGAHSLYLSIFDQGDQVYDSAVFLDRLVLGTTAAGGCQPGATVLSVTKTTSTPMVVPGGTVQYTITVNNPSNVATTVNSITDSLPLGFAYVSGSTSGVTTADPMIAGADLTWSGSFALPANGSVSLQFNATASSMPGDYLNNASATATDAGVSPSGPTAPVTVTAPPVLCGNGVLDSGEQCDDGNTADGDCCSSTCQFPTGCKTAGKSLLLLKNNTSDDSKDKVIWKWLKGGQTMLADLGSPASTTDYTLCLYAGTSSAAIPLSAGSNWRAAGTKGFKYRDPSGSPAGAQKAVLKSGAAGKAKVLVKGKGTNLPDTLVPMLPLPVTALLVNDTNNVCFEAVYDSGDVKKNDAKQFKAKAQ